MLPFVSLKLVMPCVIFIFTGTVAPSNELFAYFIVTALDEFKQFAEAFATFIEQLATTRDAFAGMQ